MYEVATNRNTNLFIVVHTDDEGKVSIPSDMVGYHIRENTFTSYTDAALAARWMNRVEKEARLQKAGLTW